jgi:hypothetical protein
MDRRERLETLGAARLVAVKDWKTHARREGQRSKV